MQILRIILDHGALIPTPCTQAKRKRQYMGELKIVVAGCVAQQEGEALLRRVPEVDLVMGPQYANRRADCRTLGLYI